MADVVNVNFVAYDNRFPVAGSSMRAGSSVRARRVLLR
jgi:hypothetical protein